MHVTPLRRRHVAMLLPRQLRFHDITLDIAYITPSSMSSMLIRLMRRPRQPPTPPLC